MIEATTPQATAEIDSILAANIGGGFTAPYHGSMGSAIDLYLRRAAEIHAAGGGASKLILPDWNIDADRGYAFKCWEAISKLDPQPSHGVQIRYI